MKKRVNITLEDKVIERIDHYADEHYTSRSGAITMLIVEATDEPEKKRKNAQYGGIDEDNDGLYGRKYCYSDN